jgi:hypothetical protein
VKESWNPTSNILIVLSVCDVTILFFHSMAEPASAFSMAKSACGLWWCPSVIQVRHIRPIGPGPALPDSRIFIDRARHGGCRVGSVTKGRPGLEWYLFTSTIRIRPNFNLTVKIVFLPTPQCFSLEARFQTNDKDLIHFTTSNGYEPCQVRNFKRARLRRWDQFP